jgi:hypothetical protein
LQDVHWVVDSRVKISHFDFGMRNVFLKPNSGIETVVHEFYHAHQHSAVVYGLTGQTPLERMNYFVSSNNITEDALTTYAEQMIERVRPFYSQGEVWDDAKEASLTIEQLSENPKRYFLTDTLREDVKELLKNSGPNGTVKVFPTFRERRFADWSNKSSFLRKYFPNLDARTTFEENAYQIGASVPSALQKDSLATRFLNFPLNQPLEAYENPSAKMKKNWERYDKLADSKLYGYLSHGFGIAVSGAFFLSDTNKLSSVLTDPHQNLFNKTFYAGAFTFSGLSVLASIGEALGRLTVGRFSGTFGAIAGLGYSAMDLFETIDRYGKGQGNVDDVKLSVVNMGLTLGSTFFYTLAGLNMPLVFGVATALSLATLPLGLLRSYLQPASVFPN